MFKSMLHDFPEVEVDVGGAGNYVPEVDAKLHRIKELYRTVNSKLAWMLPGLLVQDLVVWTALRIYIHRLEVLEAAIALKAAFSGNPMYYHKDVKLAFGDCIEKYESTYNTLHPCSTAYVALYPLNNAARLWYVFKIGTRSRVHLSHQVKLVYNELVIQAINKIAREEEQAELEPIHQCLGSIAEEQKLAEQQEVANEDEEEEQPECPSEILKDITEEEVEDIMEDGS
jgi:hypothetical protein